MIVERLLRQFSCPTGALGRVAGRMMASRNGPAYAWLAELLQVAPDDRVLEVGYGPGLGVERWAGQGAAVGGVDLSEVMQAQARRRVRNAARAGRVDLRVGEAAQLPFPDASFTRAVSLNSLQFWPSAEDGLRELARVLEPGARLVLGLRMKRADAGRFDRSRFGFTDARLDAVGAALEAVGFRDVEVRRREIAGETLSGVVAERA